MSRLRVLFFAPSAYPMGGVQTWLDYVTRGLDAQGVTVTVALAAGKHHDVERYRCAWPDLPGVVTVANATGSREGRVRALVKMLEATQPDVVVSVNIADTFDAVARLRARGASMRLAMSLHGLEPDYFDQIAQEASWLDAVIVTNCLTHRRVIECGMPRERVLYAPCGVALDDYALARNRHRARERAFGQSLDFTLGYCGRIEDQEKRFCDFSDVVRRLCAAGHVFNVRVAGEGPSARRARAQLVSALGQRVAWLGALPTSRLPSVFFSYVDALLITSPRETGPIVAWEAMAAGVPVVTSRYEGLAEEGALVDGENCLCFPVGDIPAAVDAVSRLADPALRRRLIEGGQRLVAERYSRERSVAQWAEALRAAAALPLRIVSGRTDRACACRGGRLDRLLGVAMGETVRRLLRLRFQHAEAGGEWPHAYGRADGADIPPRGDFDIRHGTPS